MKVNEYITILKNSQIETDGFEVDILSNNKEYKILRIGSTMHLTKHEEDFKFRRYFRASKYFENSWNKNWEDVEIHFSLNKYMIIDILR